MGSDPMLSLLKQFEYNVVRLPRTDISPLQVLEKQGNSLAILGDLDDFFQPGNVPLPPVSPDKQATFMNGEKTKSLKLSVGLSLLGGIIGAMTGTQVKLGVGYQKASALVFEFDDVKVNDIEPVALSKFLLAASILPSGFTKQLENDELYVINSIVKSKKFTVNATDSSGKSVDVDVPIIQAAVGGSVGVKTEGSSKSRITYEGSVPLVFGIQAVRMEFKGGKFVKFKSVSADSGAVKGGLDDKPQVEEETTKLETLKTDGPFANLA